MEKAASNPPANVIGQGVTESQIEDAVRRSGYPLQTIVASSLQSTFGVSEEWSFIDANTQELRTLDLIATRDFWDHKNQLRVRPTLNLLIECKQSDLPFVFYLASKPVWLPRFPMLAGLFRDDITAITDDNPSTYSSSIQSALGIDKDPFVANGPRQCMSFSKCMRKGKGLEVSGAETFNGIVLPLVKALQHFRQQERPPATAYYHDMHINLAVAVIDAPMIAVEVTETGQSLLYEPWIRVIRNEAVDSSDWTKRSQTHAIDVVHKSYFVEYLNEHAIPFATRFAEKALAHPIEIVTGEAFVPSLGTSSLGVFTGMKPRSLRKKSARPFTTISHVLRQLLRLR